MTCLSESAILSFLEGPLDEVAARDVEAHMAGCTDCRELVSELAKRSAARMAADGTLPAVPSDQRVCGSIVAGRFRLERVVGSGGMGEVWAAQHLVTRKMVALKFLRGAALPDRKRLYREARASSLVAHPNVLEIRDVIELEDGTPVLMMDLLIGRPLREHLAKKGRLDLGEAAALLAPAVSAVGAAHAMGIVHRDLKPDNIFLVEAPGVPVEVKVLDFGVAKLTATEGDAARTAALTQTGELVGTPYYMSPEQTFGEPDVDPRTDVWAFGVILYECLAGKRPFEGTNLGQILKGVTRGEYERLEVVRPGLPADVTFLVGQLLSVARADRPSDLRPLHALLSRYGQVATASFGPAASRPWAGAATAEIGRPRVGKSTLFAALGLLAAAAITFFVARARLASTGSVASPPVLAAPAKVAARPAVPASFEIAVSSIPPGATIFAGAHELGTTPTLLTLEATTTLRLHLAGFFDETIEATSATPRASVALRSVAGTKVGKTVAPDRMNRKTRAPASTADAKRGIGLED